MQADVLIVGVGPVGMTMACELARYGLSVRIVDKNTRRTDQSKAIVVWSRTLELLNRMGPGVADRFVQAGIKAEFTNIFAGEEQIAHVDLSSVDTPYKFVLLIQQSETERLLEQHLAGLGVTVERQAELQSFEQNAEGVTCNLVHADRGKESLEVSWLIGCDGAHSTVRHGLGMSFEGRTMVNDWVLADVHISGMEGPPAANIHWHAEGVLALFPLGGTRYRVIADVSESTTSGIGEQGVPTLEEPLLMSFSAERSAVAKVVLEATGRATTMALMKGKAKQSIRNHVASLVFGLAPVQHLMANMLSEVAVGYPDSPLNCSRDFEHSGPAPGKRAPVHEGELAVGAGSSPRFALFAAESGAYGDVLTEFAEILEPKPRQPYDSKGLWLVRPDGYVALRARGGDSRAVMRYLRALRNGGIDRSQLAFETFV
jgi:2-polyprenyl-6-methoxyphenol hydroxylase-like FAD-dependent oxidoreductase